MEFLINKYGKTKILMHSYSMRLFPTIFGTEIPPEPPIFLGIPQVYLTVFNISVLVALMLLFALVLVYHWILFKRHRKAKKVEHLYNKLCELLKREQGNFEAMRRVGRTAGGNMPNNLIDLARRVVIISKKLDELNKMLVELDELPIFVYMFFKIF